MTGKIVNDPSREHPCRMNGKRKNDRDSIYYQKKQFDGGVLQFINKSEKVKDLKYFLKLI